MDFNKLKEMGLEYAEKGKNAAMDLAERGKTQAKIVSEQAKLAKAQRQVASLRGETASDAVADYFLRKQVLVDYEASVAGLLDLGAARDSLRGVAAQLREADFRRPKVEVAQRYFLDFDSVVFTKTPKYSYSNPIPECRVYEHGTIYRLLLGTFNTKRAVSTFRGAYPLSYLVNDEGKWCYFTGGFATREEADSVQTVLKKHGFVRPEVVETTALGAAYLAGLGCGVWKSTEEIEKLWRRERTFEPTMSQDQREFLTTQWGRAVARSKGWEQ